MIGGSWRSGTFCSQGNLCEPAAHGDPAAVGQLCDSLSPLLVECGAEKDAFSGLCMNFFPQDPDLVCERLCRTASPACPDGQACLAVFSNTEVGICRPPTVCGDGALDVVGGEICDNADVSTVELTKGQSITVIVDGFRPVDAGDFSLSAAFTAN